MDTKNPFKKRGRRRGRGRQGIKPLCGLYRGVGWYHTDGNVRFYIAEISDFAIKKLRGF